jgi:GNAT superfamily N-acetyltransferase
LKPTILRAYLEHVDLVAPLFDLYRQFYQRPSDLPGARQFLADRLRGQQSVIYLAMDETVTPPTAVGFVQLYPSFSSVRMQRIWILNDLFVAESARRRGVGRLLMDAALQLARDTGAVRLALATGKTNHTAKSLYLALGYRIDEVCDHLELPVS